MALLDITTLFRLLFTIDPGYVTPQMEQLIFRVNGVDNTCDIDEKLERCNEAYFTRQGLINLEEEDLESSSRETLVTGTSRRAKVTRAMRHNYWKFPNY